MRDNTFTGARGAATVLSRSLRLDNATSWVFDLCDDLLLPPRPGVRESVFAHVSYSAFDAGCLSFVQIVLLLQGLRHHFVAPQHLLLHIFELPDQVKLIGSLRLAVFFIAKEGKHVCEKSNQIYSN